MFLSSLSHSLHTLPLLSTRNPHFLLSSLLIPFFIICFHYVNFLNTFEFLLLYHQVSLIFLSFIFHSFVVSRLPVCLGSFFSYHQYFLFLVTSISPLSPPPALPLQQQPLHPTSSSLSPLPPSPPSLPTPQLSPPPPSQPTMFPQSPLRRLNGWKSPGPLIWGIKVTPHICHISTVSMAGSQATVHAHHASSYTSRALVIHSYCIVF